MGENWYKILACCAALATDFTYTRNVNELGRSLERYTLVYDADCGRCTRFKRVVDWLDKYDRLSYVSLVDADKRGLLDSIPVTRRHKSFHLISPREKVSSGANSIPILLSLFPLGGVGSALILLFSPGQHIVNVLYATFVRLHDSGACSYKS